MDSGTGEELNYEEELPEDGLDDSGSGDGAGDNANDTSKLFEPDDQYLQIDYLEDENLTDDEPPPETATAKPDRGEKALKENETLNKESVSPQKEAANFSKSLTGVVGHESKRKKRGGRCRQRRPEFKKKLKKSLSLNPWLPDYKLDGANHLSPQRQFSSKSPMLNQFYQIPKRFLQPHGFKSTNMAGVGVNGSGFAHMSNNLTASLLGQPFSNNKTENGKMLLSRSFGFQTAGVGSPGVFDQNFSGGTNQPLALYQLNKPIKNDKVLGEFCNRFAGAAFGEQDPVKKEDQFINVQYKSLEEDEKKVIMLKKEARLKRFMLDDVIKKDKLTDSGFEESSLDSSPKLQFVQKEEKKDCQQKESRASLNEPPLGKPEINKEVLLRKVNPFGGDLGTSDFALAITAKTEKIGIKVERDDSKAWQGSNCLGRQLTKTEAKPSPCPELNLGAIKTEKEPHVKFVRTISKSFDELTFRKPKTESTPDKSSLQGKLFPLAGHTTCCGPKQMEPQLTGCIVKVLNIPPSTTTNDILALCSPIGIVMEVKLNCPKENSVVIRFAEPKCAENFFSLYHGQKMNNYFLNVIVV